MITQSILNEVELSTGTQVFVQVNNNRTSISIDGPEISFSLWLKPSELKQLAEVINKTIEEQNEPN